MSVRETRDSGETQQSGRLRANSLGLVGVVFMVVAMSAPITVVTANLPVAVGFGNGIGAPSGYMFAGAVLTIFSFGFVALSRHITAAGAFYSLVSRGWSRIPGLAAGIMSMVGYTIALPGVLAVFGVLASGAVVDQFGADVSWWVFSFAAWATIAVLSYREVSVAATVLAVLLLLEIVLLLTTALAVLGRGGGPDGIIWESVNPAAAFDTNGVEGGVVGLGMLIAFWSWAGFESTAIYGEESKNPKVIVPRATLIAVIGIGVFYTFVAWMVISGNGAEQSVRLASGANPFELLYAPSREFVGDWLASAFQWVVLAGSFACCLAAQQVAARYFYAFGRDRILPAPLGRVHPRHSSPHLASVTVSAVSALVLVLTLGSGADPYGTMYVFVAVVFTLLVLVVEVMCSVAVVYYFHIKKRHPETAGWWRTLASPVLGGLGMVYVVYLMFDNLGAVAGTAAETPLFKTIPYLVAGIPAVCMLTAWYWRSSGSEHYAKIGSTVFEDVEPGVAQDRVS